jgi:ribonuclease J
MNMNFKKYKEEFLFLPLSGVEEIGMNLNLFYYKGKWLIVDMGIGFGEADKIPGADVMVPDPSFLKSIENDIVGLVITHAHEDHLGAIQYLFKKFRFPQIYTSNFTAEFLLRKLSEYKLENRVNIKRLKLGSNLQIGPFDIALFELNHSVPEMNALVFNTKYGKIVHSGDWRFDDAPVIGRADDYEALAKMGEGGVTALICDSTNIFNKGESGSEGTLQKKLISLIKEKKNLVVVSSFASNVGRLVSIMKAAKEANRKLLILGSSMHRMIEVAKKSNFIPSYFDEISPEEFKKYKRKDVLILATGSQGEDRAAIARMTFRNHPHIKLLKGDTIIFSSKIIPGNEKKIFAITNELATQEIEIITEKDHEVHVSGHPTQKDLAKLYGLLKPKYAIPVHGEAWHIREHAKLALDWGAKESVSLNNGDCLLIGKELEKVGKVPVKFLAVDGKRLVPTDSHILKERNMLANSGFIYITLAIDKSARIIEGPIIDAPGLLSDHENDIYMEIEELVYEVVSKYAGPRFSIRKNNNAQDVGKIEAEIKGAVRKYIRNLLNKAPLVIVSII